jgi:hypothetical protein
VRAEARARFEAEDVDSCGAPAEMRRRSEEKLGGGEALDNLHGSAAKRTLPQRVNGRRQVQTKLLALDDRYRNIRGALEATHDRSYRGQSPEG